MERPRIRYLTNVKDFRYYDVEETDAYLAQRDEETARLKEEVAHWKLAALAPR